jgi:hypothetical protein
MSTTQTQNSDRAQKADLQIARLRPTGGAPGPILAPHRLGPDFVSFKDWLSWPEVIAHFPEDSDEGVALAYLQEQACFGGTRKQSSKALQRHIKQSPLYRLSGNNYWHTQRIFAAIFRGYDGMLNQKERNAKALTELPAHALRAEQRAALRTANERLRKAAQRNPVKAAEYTTARIEALQAKLPELAENVSKRENQLRKAQNNLDTSIRTLKETEVSIAQLKSQIDDGLKVRESAQSGNEPQESRIGCNTSTATPSAQGESNVDR